MAYDEECAALARHFLQDTELDLGDHVAPLAQDIQDAVEAYFEALGIEDKSASRDS